jgi:hypothetical protein
LTFPFLFRIFEEIKKEENQDELYKYQDITEYHQTYISIYKGIGTGENQH